jgi:spore coat polysaccharide biosynthesis protein SpsF
MSDRFLAILQARMTSSRLPGKVLMPILGKPMILHQIERIRRSQKIGGLIIATSVDPSDDAIASTCTSAGLDIYRGSLHDVLDRFHGAIQRDSASAVVRLTGDCPLIDPEVIDRVVDEFSDRGCDYASNTLVPTYPDGLDVEVISRPVLEKAWRDATSSYDREHVTPYIYNRPKEFVLGNVANSTNHSGLRWTVDKQSDLDFVRKIFEGLYPDSPAFGTEDIISFLGRSPELVSLNTGPVRSGPLTAAPGS